MVSGAHVLCTSLHHGPSSRMGLSQIQKGARTTDASGATPGTRSALMLNAWEPSHGGYNQSDRCKWVRQPPSQEGKSEGPSLLTGHALLTARRVGI